MARPKVKIDPAWSRVIRQICLDQNVSQAALSRNIHLSQQTVSKIAQGKASLTKETAEAIIKVYPEYRFQWLMGLDEYPTASERDTNRLLDEWWTGDQQRERVEKLLLVHGYSVERLFDPQTGLPVKGNTVLRIAPDTSDNNILSLAHSARPQVLVSISGSDGKQIQIEDDIYAQIWKDISDYARMKIQRLFELEAKNDG